ncbi:MAG: ATP synthase subunit B family protein [Aggregatilineales bacterium]
MDIQHLVDRLEDLIDDGRHLPMTKMTVIDEERALEIIDQMRISVPEEIDKANRVVAQRDRLMGQANEEAARVLELAREKSDALIQRDSITQAAKNQAANIIEQARQDAATVRAEADQYVLQVLNELEGQLIRTLTVVRNGINKLMQDREAVKARAEALENAPAAPPIDPAAPGTLPVKQPEMVGANANTAAPGNNPARLS